MAKFGKKLDKNNEDEILAKYVTLNQQAKVIEKEITPLKPVVLAIVQERGNTILVGGLQLAIASKPKYKFSKELEGEIQKLEDAKAFLDIKIARAKANKEYTIYDKGEYVTVKAVKKDE